MSTNTAVPQDSVKIAMNLDTLERGPDVTKEAFVFVVAGRAIKMKDPQAIDWQDMLRIAADTSSIFNFAMEREDYLFFKRQHFPMWKMDKLILAYQEHYGLDLRVQGPNGSGSPTS